MYNSCQDVTLLGCVPYFSFQMGKKLQKKLSLQVKKETKSIRALLEEYSACQSLTDASDTMSLSEAIKQWGCGAQ